MKIHQSQFWKNHLALKQDDYDPILAADRALARGTGIALAGAAVGSLVGANHQAKDRPFTEVVAEPFDYQVTTGSESYVGTCSGVTSGGEFFSYECMKTRATGHWRQDIYRREVIRHTVPFPHTPLQGALLGFGLGLATAVVLGATTELLTK